jgi:hypothetical protein
MNPASVREAAPGPFAVLRSIGGAERSITGVLSLLVWGKC